MFNSTGTLSSLSHQHHSADRCLYQQQTLSLTLRPAVQTLVDASLSSQHKDFKGWFLCITTWVGNEDIADCWELGTWQYHCSKVQYGKYKTSSQTIILVVNKPAVFARLSKPLYLDVKAKVSAPAMSVLILHCTGKLCVLTTTSSTVGQSWNRVNCDGCQISVSNLEVCWKPVRLSDQPCFLPCLTFRNVAVFPDLNN